MYYEVWQSASNYLWYWHLKAANHEIVAQGEGYRNKADALSAFTLVKGSYNAPVYNR